MFRNSKLHSLACAVLICLGLTAYATYAEAKVKPFKFVQLTDIHLSNKSAIDALQCSIDEINATDSIDFALITGDITDQGDRATMQRAKSYFDKLKVPYYVVLGNHETTWSESGCMDFQDIFGQESLSFEHNGIKFICFNSGPLLKMAYGHVSPKDIKWATEELMKNPDQPAIIVSHYPMMDGDVDNWYNVTDALRKPGNVRLFIGGHYHSLRNLTYDGMPGILMRSNLRDPNKRSGYGLYVVTENEIKVYVKNAGVAPEYAATFTLEKPTYDPAGKAEKYPDYSDNNKFPFVKKVWMNETSGAFYSSPAVEGKTVYTGDNEGDIKAFSLKDGSQKWAFHTNGRIVGGLAVKKGIVVCGSADKNIYGLNAKNGKLLWKVATNGPVLGAVTIEGNIAYIGSSDGTMRAINLNDGKPAWTFSGVKGYIMTKPLVTADKVIFGAWDSNLYCLHRNDGSLMWKWSEAPGHMHYSPAQVWPKATQKNVFIVDPQRTLSSIDIQTGATNWRTFQSTVRESMGLSEDGKRVYGKTMQDSVVCYDATSDKPKELWACNVGFGYEHGPCMLPEKGGIVFGSTKEGLIFAIEAKTGKLLWRHKVSNSLMSTVVPLSKKRILFSDTDGHVGLLSVK